MCGIFLPMKQETKLTTKQEKVLKFIRERVEDNLPPTIREIAGELGFSSTGTVRDYLAALEKKGYLKRANNKSRAIELLNNNPGIPIIGAIAAGKPNLAYEDIEGYLEPSGLLPADISRDEVFALKVKGESMIEAGIMDGDIAVVRKQKTADSGDIIAALLDNNEVTLKRLRRRAGKNFLEAANKNYPPIREEFNVMGKLITIIRKYRLS